MMYVSDKSMLGSCNIAHQTQSPFEKRRQERERDARDCLDMKRREGFVKETGKIGYQGKMREGPKEEPPGVDFF